METLRKIKLSHFETSPELAEIKVSYKSKSSSKIKITNSKEVFEVLFPLYDRDIIELQEQFFLLLLNRASRIIGWIKLSLGGTVGTIVDPRIVFSLALKTNACSIILSHNHPSGNIQPSEADISLTNKINAASKLLEIKLLDHLIISPEEKYYSFADEGIM